MIYCSSFPPGSSFPLEVQEKREEKEEEEVEVIV